jgi:hypothetical protein
MIDIDNIPFPPHWINAYLFNKLSNDYGPSKVGMGPTQSIVPFFATTTTGREELYQQLKMSNTGVEQPTMITYDRLMRFRVSPFYGIKREQLIYTIYGSLRSVQNINIVVSQLLDREDAAAQDINEWCKNNPISLNGQSISPNVFFHNFRVYQIDETRDLLELNSVNLAEWASKIIIEYDYHANWKIDEENSMNEFK